MGSHSLAICPREIFTEFPKLYQVVGMTAGWLSLWAWLMVGALSLVAVAVEWAFRHKKRYHELLRKSNICFKMLQALDNRTLSELWLLSIRVKNVTSDEGASLKETLSGSHCLLEENISLPSKVKIKLRRSRAK